MSPDAAAWWAQVPWVPLGVLAAAAAAWMVLSKGGAKNRRALAAKLEAGALVLDVRTKAEYAGGHYPGARNLPVDSLASNLKNLGDKAGPVVVYCASGVRSAQAASILRAAGFTDVTNAGGYGQMPPSGMLGA